MPAKLQAYRKDGMDQEPDFGQTFNNFRMTGSKENWTKSMRDTGMSLDKTAKFQETASGAQGMRGTNPYFKLLVPEDHVGLDIAEDFNFNP